MKHNQLEKLVEEFPKIFIHRNGDKNHYRIASGFECGDGWYDLLRHLCNVIQHEIDSNKTQREYIFSHNEMIAQAILGDRTLLEEKYKHWDPGYKDEVIAKGYLEAPGEIDQLEVDLIKEKFGGLRFHKRGGSEYSNGAIALAESLSFTICDVCGEKGKVGNQSASWDNPKGNGYYATRCQKHWGYREEF
jgi:hypothetical protein